METNFYIRDYNSEYYVRIFRYAADKKKLLNHYNRVIIFYPV